MNNHNNIKKILVLLISIIILLFGIIIFSNNPVKSDDAPIEPMQSGNVVPVNNDDIQLKNEQIDIYMNRNYYNVEVNYTFVNTGKKQNVIMGFPNFSVDETVLVKKISNFETYNGDKELEIFTMDADKIFYEIEEYKQLLNTDSLSHDYGMLSNNYGITFEGNGINEQITVWIGESGGDYTARALDKIAILNGYNKSEETFYNNNRVKKIKIEYINYDDKKLIVEKELEDINTVQYIELDKPTVTYKMILTILEVYEGDKYDDTCISDIEVYTTKLE